MPLPLLPLQSVLWQLDQADRLTKRLLEKPPAVWGRRRFGVFPLLPQILKKGGFSGALHVVLDDGIYPDAEQSKVRWEGTGGTSIDAWSRIPLAADAAVSFLRFPDRMAESMDNDHVAAVALARWPEVKSPFFDDLRRMHKYAPGPGAVCHVFRFFFKRPTAPRDTPCTKRANTSRPIFFNRLPAKKKTPSAGSRGMCVADPVSMRAPGCTACMRPFRARSQPGCDHPS